MTSKLKNPLSRSNYFNVKLNKTQVILYVVVTKYFV